MRWIQLCDSLNILWHCLSLGLKWKLTFSSPVDVAEFSNFAGILSAALSQHHLLSSWLRSLSAVILEPKKIKSVTVSTFSSSICHEVTGLDAMILVFWMSSFKPALSLFHPHIEALSLALPFFGIGMKTDLFQSCGHCWVFHICWHIEGSTFTASSFRISNSSTEIPSPPLSKFLPSKCF